MITRVELFTFIYDRATPVTSVAIITETFKPTKSIFRFSVNTGTVSLTG